MKLLFRRHRPSEKEGRKSQAAIIPNNAPCFSRAQADGIFLLWSGVAGAFVVFCMQFGRVRFVCGGWDGCVRVLAAWRGLREKVAWRRCAVKPETGRFGRLEWGGVWACVCRLFMPPYIMHTYFSDGLVSRGRLKADF
ncbi:hypothetical protein [Neisseria zoodegmatis]|uniref:Uncharacterized protein n=1 Tax=Neisseria zoodegmatis TaxID=326523 RepID=A0ABX3WCK1_9NEIS|nr:hypothetical protein [Neisseria zoodegmatis]OSI09250.1 hypothetical protein BWD10_09955 [Neisseria zoodegmatis]